MVREDDDATIRLTRFPGLEIKLDTPKGRGVFATEFVPQGTIVDVCPVLLLGLEENERNWPILDEEGTTRTGQAIVFGLGSMFNHHSTRQNVGWERNFEQLIIVYKTLRDIHIGEELCISYGGRLWFKDTDREQDEHESNETDILSIIQLD